MRLMSVSFICFIIVLSGCATGNFTVADGYKWKLRTAHSLAIAPFGVSLRKGSGRKERITAIEQVTYDSVFQMEFPGVFASRLKSDYLKSAYTIRTLPSVTLSNRMLRLDEGDSLSVDLPDDGVCIGFGSVKPEYVLFVSNVTLHDSEGVVGKNSLMLEFGGDMGLGPKLVPGPTEIVSGIYHDADCAYWDNQKGVVAACGHITSFSPYVSVESPNEAWVGSIYSFVHEILFSSPFK
jgi:hypothetical protein